MPHKKKLFTKNNSVKFVLLHGNTDAVNADGEKLENVLVPVSRNYKAGSSLLMSNISTLCNAGLPDEENENEPNLENILNQFDDADSEIVVEELPRKMKKMHLSNATKKSDSFDDPHKEDAVDFGDDIFDSNGQFSDVSEDDSYDEDSSDAEDDVDPNCPETVKMYNTKFKKVLEEYEEDQIGPLDDEEIGGYLSRSSKYFSNLVGSDKEEEMIALGNYDRDMKTRILNYAEDSEDEKIVEIVMEKPIEHDCESIISTYSNKYNHPTVIKEEKVKKIEVPSNPLKKRLTKSQLKTLSNEKGSDDESDDNLSVSSTAFNVRMKGETPEQRRERKNLFKEAKRESRILKKENKLAFKREKKMHVSQTINAQRNAGIRLL